MEERIPEHVIDRPIEVLDEEDLDANARVFGITYIHISTVLLFTEMNGAKFTIPPFYDELISGPEIAKLPPAKRARAVLKKLEESSDDEELLEELEEQRQQRTTKLASAKKVWMTLVRREMPRAHRQMMNNKAVGLRASKVRAESCMKDVKRRYDFNICNWWLICE